MNRIKTNLIVLALALLPLTLVGCTNSVKDEAVEENNEYILVNGKTPVEVRDKLTSAIIDIYMPLSEEDIEEGINILGELSTENEFNELKSSVGKFDETKKALVNNIDVSIGLPENMENHKMKYVVTFTIETESSAQNILMEFKCNTEGLIQSHSIWTNNSI